MGATASHPVVSVGDMEVVLVDGGRGWITARQCRWEVRTSVGSRTPARGGE
jgi:hypothetical protein